MAKRGGMWKLYFITCLQLRFDLKKYNIGRFYLAYFFFCKPVKTQLNVNLFVCTAHTKFIKINVVLFGVMIWISLNIFFNEFNEKKYCFRIPAKLVSCDVWTVKLILWLGTGTYTSHWLISKAAIAYLLYYSICTTIYITFS